MTQQEALQWLIDNKVTFRIVESKGTFAFCAVVRDANGDSYHTAFHLEPEFVMNYLHPTASSLRKLIDG